MKFGERLKALRSETSETQESISKTFHVSRQTISNWENERSYPDIEMLIKLSDYYNISLDELIKGDISTMKNIKDIYKYKEITYLSSILIIVSLFFMIVGRKIFGDIFSLFMGFLIILIVVISRILLYKIEKNNGITNHIIDFKTADEVLFMLEKKRRKSIHQKSFSYVITVTIFILYIVMCSYISNII